MSTAGRTATTEVMPVGGRRKIRWPTSGCFAAIGHEGSPRPLCTSRPSGHGAEIRSAPFSVLAVKHLRRSALSLSPAPRQILKPSRFPVSAYCAYPRCASFSMLCTRQYSFHCASTFFCPRSVKRSRPLLCAAGCQHRLDQVVQGACSKVPGRSCRERSTGSRRGLVSMGL